MRSLLLLALACSPGATLADSKAGEKKAQLCLLCHKPAPGASAVPLLEGLPATYLVAATTAYKTGARKDPAMSTNAQQLSPQDIRDIADYFASRPPFSRPPQNLDQAQVSAGRARLSQVQCVACHGSDFHGDKKVPRLAGQTYHYLINQLRAFARSDREHPQQGMPRERKEIEEVASYLASLQ